MDNPLDYLKKLFGKSGHITNVQPDDPLFYTPTTEEEHREAQVLRDALELPRGAVTKRVTAGERIEAGQMIYIHPETGEAHVVRRDADDK